MTQHRPRSCAPRRLPAVLGTFLLLLGCSYFPSHEEVYIPIPLKIGEEEIRNGDTSYVLRGMGYELIAPKREILAETQHDIESAGRQFQRYFGAVPPVVRIRYVDSLPPMRPGSDSVAWEQRGNELLLPTRRAGYQRSGDRSLPVRPAYGTARLWVTEHARRTRSADAPADTIRIPAWIASAMVDLIALSPGRIEPARQLWNERARIIPLAELFALDRFTPELRPNRRMSRNDAMRGEVRRIQSLSIAQFLVEREGPEFLGRAAEQLFHGATVPAVLAEARNTPKTVAELEQAWRDWIRDLTMGR